MTQEGIARCVFGSLLRQSVGRERDAKEYCVGKEKSALYSVLDDKSDAEKMKIISALAAERVMASFFSYLDLNPHFEIKIEGANGDWYDLADAFEIPLICGFHEDGWVSEYSKLPSYLNLVEQQQEDDNS